MPTYRKTYGEEEKEAPKEATASGTFKSFIGKAKTKKFIAEWHKQGYTKAGVQELLYELYQRYGGDGDDDDEDTVLGRASDMLDVLKSVADKFALFKKE
jgi:hypothetical protein